jgi:hypothetical protein
MFLSTSMYRMPQTNTLQHRLGIGTSSRLDGQCAYKARDRALGERKRSYQPVMNETSRRDALVEE